MSTLGVPLAFPLGSEYEQPYIVNLAPAPDELDFGLTKPIRFSVRDAETFVLPGMIRVEVGYAQVRASGTQEYTEVLPRTRRSSVLPGAVDLVTQPTIVEVMGGIQITKTTNGPQQSTYFTSVDAGSGFRSVMATVSITPNTISNGQPGAVWGLEIGPRNTGVYLFFERSGGVPQIRFCGPANNVGAKSPNEVLVFDWSTADRYILVWNEIGLKVELYSVIGSNATLLHEENISAFQVYDLIPGSTPRRGGAADMTMVYGIEGAIGQQVTFGNVAVTTNVGFPILGLDRQGEFYTTRRTNETVRYEGGDPIKAEISSWFKPDDLFFANPDSAGTIRVLPSNVVRLTKNTINKSYAVYREEPGLLSSDANGLLVEGTFFAIPGLLTNARVTGMGFMLYDGQSVFYIGLLSGSTRTIGLLKAGGSPAVSAAFLTPSEDIDWSNAAGFRLVVDPRRSKIDLYGEDVDTPLMTMDFDRSDLPTAAEFGIVGSAPFVAFGHVADIATTGSFDLTRLKYACTYQAYESPDEDLPNEAPTDPLWELESIGTEGLNSPLYGTALLGGGYGLLPIGLHVSDTGGAGGLAYFEDGRLILESTPGTNHMYTRSLAIDDQRGAFVEFKMNIRESKPRARSGYFVAIDDAVRTYMLSFVDTEIGKFVCIPDRVSSGFIEHPGTERIAAQLSYEINWSEPHIYRLEKRPLDGVYLFIDNDPEPVLSIPDSLRINFPTSQFLSPTIAFGHLTLEGCKSATDFVRVGVSEGYEISTRRVETTTELEDNVRNTQAIVVAFVEDDDP